MRKAIIAIVMLGALCARADNYDIIHKFAKAKWPGDIEMQQYECQQQTKAANAFDDLTEIEGIPDSVVKEMKKIATQEYPDDFSMRIISINEQVRRYKAAHPKP